MKKYLILALCAIISVGLITGCGSKKEDKEKNKIERKDGYTEGTIDLGSYENKMLIEATGNSYHIGDKVPVEPGYAVLSFDNDKVNYLTAEQGYQTVDKEISNLYKVNLLQIPGIKFSSYFTYDGKKYNYEIEFTFSLNYPVYLAEAYPNQNVSVKMAANDIIKPYLENNLSNSLIEFAEKNGVDNIKTKYRLDLDDKELSEYGILLISLHIKSVEEA